MPRGTFAISVSEPSLRPALSSRVDAARLARRPSLHLREAHHAEAEDSPLSVLRRESPLHAERGAPRRQELSPLRHARRAPRVAREIVRPDADPTYETRRPGLDEDRYAGVERRASEEGRETREEGLAEDGSAFQAVAPLLPDGRAAFPALSALRGLIRLHDDEIRAGNLVPPRLADEEEGEIVGPCLELDECEFLRGEQFVDALYEVPRILEPDDFLLIAQVEPGLSEVQFLVEPVEILRLHGELERAESQVDIAEEGVRLEHLGHAESEPVREDAGDRAIRLRPAFRDERRFAARVDSHALGGDGLRGRDGEAEIDEGRVDFVDDRLDLRRLRAGRGFRFRRLHLRFF